jgi:F-type H+-transporting ATPase subunit b
MIDIDWTLFAQLGNFLLLVFLLNVVLFRPIRMSLKARQAKMAGYEGDVAQLAEQEQGLQAEVQEKLTEARRQGLSQRESLRQEGSQAEASLLEQVKKDVEAEWTRVEAKIKADMDQARKALKDQAQSFAQALAAKILGRDVA